MKKTIWIIAAAALLLAGLVLLLCTGRGNEPDPTGPVLPSTEQNQSPVQQPNQTDSPEPGAAEPRASDPASAETKPDMPVDWNGEPSGTEPGKEGQSQPAGQPGSSEAGNPSPASTDPRQTEPEGESSAGETGGQVVNPILPPDIFP